MQTGIDTQKKWEPINNTDYSYDCRYCDMIFNQLEDKKSHEKTCAERKLYACRFCDKKFGWPQSCREHER